MKVILKYVKPYWYFVLLAPLFMIIEDYRNYIHGLISP